MIGIESLVFGVHRDKVVDAPDEVRLNLGTHI
jgi:hypothetical protein